MAWSAIVAAVPIGISWLQRSGQTVQLKSSDELLGRDQSVGLERVVFRRHDATHLIAPDVSSAVLPDNGRAPAPRLSLVGDYRKLGDVSHWLRAGATALR
jgi:hypothetical protein